jgi:membrane complex biogenesis BtpA family protein
MLTDQGIIEGDAYETIRYREQMSADIKIFADVLVKHGTPLGDQSIEQAARDTAYRGLADAIVVTGSGTGQPADMEDLMRAEEAVPDVPVLVGSGVHESNVVKVLSVADGVIVGTSLKEGGIAANPVDQARVAALIATVKGVR